MCKIWSRSDHRQRRVYRRKDTHTDRQTDRQTETHTLSYIDIDEHIIQWNLALRSPHLFTSKVTSPLWSPLLRPKLNSTVPRIGCYPLKYGHLPIKVTFASPVGDRISSDVPLYTLLISFVSTICLLFM